MEVFLFLVGQYFNVISIVVWIRKVVIVVKNRKPSFFAAFYRDALIFPYPPNACGAM